MSIFKESFDKYVIDQMQLREKLMYLQANNQLTDAGLIWMNGKTAWVRMTSSTDVIDPVLAKELGVKVGNDMSKKHILSGGELYYKDNKFSLRKGVGSGGGSYGDRDILTQNEYGLRPMSGIKSLSIQSKGAYGSLREATIVFQVNSLQELDRLTLLYSVPGYSTLIEYGWSQYFGNKTNEGYRKLSDPTYYNILDAKQPKEQIFRDLYSYNPATLDERQGKVAQHSGCYDAFYGLIKNLDIENLSNNSYQVTVSVISMGEIIESLKVNYISRLDINTTLGKTLTDSGIQYGEDKDLKKAYYESKLNGDLEYIFIQAKKNATGHKSFLKIPSMILGQVFCCQLAIKDSHDGYEQFNAYIRFSDLIEIINKRIAFHDEYSNPIVLLSTKYKGSDIQCKAHYLQTSTNAKVCLIKTCDNPKLAEPKLVGQFLKNAPSEGQFFLKDGYFNKGSIGNIYLNVKYLQMLLKTSRNENNQVDLLTYIQNILKDVNISLGNINNFQPYVEPNTNTVYIVDMNYIEDNEMKDAAKGKHQITLGKNSSIVREYKLHSAIFPEQSTIIAIAAQAGGGKGMVGIDSFTFDLIYQGIEDRHISKKLEPGLVKNQAVSTDAKRQERWVEFINQVGFYTQNLDKEGKAGVVVGYDTSEALHQLIMDEIKEQIEQNNSTTHTGRSITPIKLILKLDGISGINIGQIFVVNEDQLPRMFRGTKTHKLGFIVRSVNHVIENNDWTTEIDTQTCILDNGGHDIKKPTNCLIFKNIKFKDTNKDGK